MGRAWGHGNRVREGDGCGGGHGGVVPVTMHPKPSRNPFSSGPTENGPCMVTVVGWLVMTLQHLQGLQERLLVVQGLHELMYKSILAEDVLNF